jgi:hypothetical protein
MTDLPYEQHRRLINVLKRIHLFQNQEGRSLLLIGLSMVTGVERSSVRETDLSNIVSAVARWGTLPDGKPALLILFNNARDAAGESTDGYELVALQAEFTTSEIPAFRTLSPIERAERYRQLKAAYEAGEDQRVLDLAVGIEQDHNVPQLMIQARARLNHKHHLLEELSDAYATDEWAQVIRLARQLGAAAPPQVAEWVSRAWLEVPVAERVLIDEPYDNTIEFGIFSVAVTSNGQLAFTGAENHMLRLWDLASGECRYGVYADGMVWAVAALPDGQLVLSGAETLQLWNLSSRQMLHSFEGHSSSVYAVAVTHDGRQALSGSSDQTLRLWDLANRRCLRTLIGHSDAVAGVAITHDARHALSGSHDKTLRLWDLATGEIVRILEGHTNAVLTVAVTSDGRHALSGSEDCTVRLWDLTAGQYYRVFEGHTREVYAVAFMPNKRYALSSSADRTMRLWDLVTGQELRVFTNNKGSIDAFALTPNGCSIVTSEVDGILRIWTLPEGLLS